MLSFQLQRQIGEIWVYSILFFVSLSLSLFRSINFSLYNFGWIHFTCTVSSVCPVYVPWGKKWYQVEKSKNRVLISNNGNPKPEPTRMANVCRCASVCILIRFYWLCLFMVLWFHIAHITHNASLFLFLWILRNSFFLCFTCFRSVFNVLRHLRCTRELELVIVSSVLNQITRIRFNFR